MSGWFASLRIARREAWRHRGRSALVVVMIGLPVAVIAFGAVAFRTLQLEPDQQVTSEIGTAADAFVSKPAGYVIAQSPPGMEASVGTGKQLRKESPTIEELVPSATQVLRTRWRYGGGFSAPVVAGDRRDYPSIRELDYTNPLAAGLVTQVSGASPTALDEVVVTADLAQTLGVQLGDEITVKDIPYRVVGTVELTYGSDWEQVIGGPGAFKHLNFSLRGQPPENNGWLLAVPGGLDYEQWKELNAQGSWVASRAVADNPPEPCSAEIPPMAHACDGGAMARYESQQLAETGALVALVIVMGLLQVILLVGPAFAIGRRTQTRDLALVAAVGGDAKAVRRVVLSGGVVLGLAGGVAGLVVGVASFQVLRPLVSSLAGTALFATDVRPELLLVLLVAILTGTLAAWLPARAASRQDVVAALAGRRGAVSTRRGMPIAGAAALTLGTTIALFGTTPGNMAMLLFGAVIAELGLVALAPWLVGAASRMAARLPTAPRLALRDAGRNRMRAGTAVCAVLAAVAGATAMGIWVVSDSANAERHYVPTVPEGYVALTVDRGQWPGGDISGVEDALPVADAVAMTGKPGRSCIFQRCEDWVVQKQRRPCVVADGSGMGFCGYSFGSAWNPWMYGEGRTYRALTGFEPDASVRSTLDQGGLVVGTTYASAFVDDSGTMTFENRQTGELVDVPATVAPTDEVGAEPRFELLFSDGARERLGLASHDLGYTFVTTRAPTGAELAQARESVAQISEYGNTLAGQPFRSDTSLALRLLLAGALVLAVAATATATGLASADAIPDMATLAAIGAAPRTRRWLSASQAGVVSLLGTALGVVGGLVIGVAAIGATTDNFAASASGVGSTLPVAIPWDSVALLAVVIPAVAMSLAFLFSRSSLPMVRRID